jgi:hypothetical protein
MGEPSILDIDENKRVMTHYIFNEDLVFKNKIFSQLKLNEDTFAYGILLPREIDIYDKKGNVVGKEQEWSPVLITSDRRLIEVTKEAEISHNIKFESIPTHLPLRWSLDSIKSYLENDNSIPELSPREVIESIKDKSEKISAFREKRWYKFNALLDAGTYVFELFNSFPIKEERGLSGTGKTKEMNRSKNVTFNSTDILINPSEATLFRETHDKRPTKYIDEAEKLFTFKKGVMESDNRVELINGSYTKGSAIPRVEKIKDKFVVVYYKVYSPTRIGSINGLFGATEGRAITQIHTRSLDKDSRGEIEVDDNDVDFRLLRNNLYLFGLKYWKQIEKNYKNNSLFKNLKLKKRDLQLWRPILSIAKLVGDDWFDEMVEFANELSEMKIDDLLSEASFDYLCLTALKEAIKIYNDSEKHYLNTIKQFYCKERAEEEKANIYLNRNIGQHLKKIGFSKKRDSSGTYIIANKTIFDEIVSPIAPQLAFISTPSTLSTPNKGKEVNNSVDEVKINEDKDIEVVKMVKINEDNVDNIEKRDIFKIKSQEEQQNA